MKQVMGCRHWTESENKYMIEHYPDDQTADVAKHLNRTFYGVMTHAHTLGLYKSDKFVHPTHFQKGHVSANKGQKMSPELYEKCKGTMFKKGSTPKNKAPVGTIRFRTDHSSFNYFWIKIEEPGLWKELHRWLYEIQFGPIPQGMNVVFADGDTGNLGPENFELITRKEIMARNTIHNCYPEELKNAVMALGRYKRKIKTYERRKRQSEKNRGGSQRDQGSPENPVRVHEET